MSTPVTARTRNRGLWRWTVALIATLLLVVSGSGLVAFAQDGAAGSQGPQFVPEGSPLYAEARLDMPDGQDEALAQMLTAFPGFADARASRPSVTRSSLRSLEMVDSGGHARPHSGVLSALTGEIGLAVTSLSAEDVGSGRAAHDHRPRHHRPRRGRERPQRRCGRGRHDRDVRRGHDHD